jgi:hypothetical protein
MPNPTYDSTLKSARMTATRDGLASGDLQILTSADAVLVTFPLSATGGTVSGDTWTVQFGAGTNTSTIAATGTGTAAKARFRNSGGTVRVTGVTAGASGSGAGVIIDNTSIATGQDITVTAASIQHAP